MPPPITEAEFAVLLARAGLTLPAGQSAGILAVWGAVQAMQAAVRTPPPGAAPLSAAAASAEPAITYSLARGA
ncbi:MAG: hypothetical protein K2X49_24805 [Acetobacteraceae bacterium]|nr:hypothetical protein [Acetobacteraceae bacterium]